jgi:Enoyl-CoA hydratase/isomerase
MMLSSSSFRAAAAGGRRLLLSQQPIAVPPRGVLFSSTTNAHGDGALKDSYEYIRAEKKEGGVGLITLHRPAALNALSEGLFVDLIHAAKALDRDDTIGCLVLTGSTKAFAAGADIKEMCDVTLAQAFSQVLS